MRFFALCLLALFCAFALCLLLPLLALFCAFAFSFALLRLFCDAFEVRFRGAVLRGLGVSLRRRAGASFLLPHPAILIKKRLQNKHNNAKRQLFWLPALERLLVDGNDFTAMTPEVT